MWNNHCISWISECKKCRQYTILGSLAIVHLHVFCSIDQQHFLLLRESMAVSFQWTLLTFRTHVSCQAPLIYSSKSLLYTTPPSARNWKNKWRISCTSHVARHSGINSWCLHHSARLWWSRHSSSVSGRLWGESIKQTCSDARTSNAERTRAPNAVCLQLHHSESLASWADSFFTRLLISH